MCYLLLLCCFGEFGLGVDLGVVSLLVFFVMMMMMMVVVVMEYYLHKLYLLLKWLCCALLISNCFFGLIGRERERENGISFPRLLSWRFPYSLYSLFLYTALDLGLYRQISLFLFVGLLAQIVGDTREEEDP